MSGIFDYTPELVNSLLVSLSEPRLSTYLRSANGGINLALRLYVWNTDLGESLYGPLQALEATLRNALHNALTEPFGDCWYDCCHLENREGEQIAETKEYLSSVGKRVVAPNIVATLRLGFWTGILDRLYENDLWRPYLRKAFLHATGPLRRQEVFAIVDRARKLRNRIAHHEPIFNRPLAEEYDSILDLVGWICLQTAGWVRHHSHFDKIRQERPD